MVLTCYFGAVFVASHAAGVVVVAGRIVPVANTTGRQKMEISCPKLAFRGIVEDYQNITFDDGGLGCRRDIQFGWIFVGKPFQSLVLKGAAGE